MRLEDQIILRDDARQPPEFLSVGRVVRPHGVHGALKVISFSSPIRPLTPSSTVYLGPHQDPVIVRSVQSHQDGYILFLEGCVDRNAAERLRDLVVYVRFDDTEPLHDDEYYYWQIIGLEVVTQDGEILGDLVDILETGANDVYVVKEPTGGELLLPNIASVIMEVDLERTRLVVNLLPGLRPE